MKQILSKYLMILPILFVRREPVIKSLKLYRKTQWWSDTALKAYQSRKLIQLFKHAKSTVPFYKSLYENVEQDSIHGIQDIESLPFVTKADIRNNKSEMVSSNAFLFKSIKTTGGSTGQPVTVIKTNESLACERAATWRAYEWAGIHIGDSHARFWGVPLNRSRRAQFKVIDWLLNRIRLSAFSFSEASLMDYYQRILKFRPCYLYGYVSMIHLFAKFMQANRLDLPKEVKCIVVTSEILSEPMRKEIKDVLRREVFNEYGCGEVGSIAHECPSGRLHIMAENLLVEVIKDEKPAKEGETGEIVVTELNNYAMPLIRYRLNDFAELGSAAQCNCGRTLPSLGRVVGRAYDMLRTDDGRIFHGEFFMYLFEDLKKKNNFAVNQFQVIQISQESLRIKIVPGKNYSHDVEEWIAQIISNSMGISLNIKFELVDYIPREPSGKIRLIKSMKTS